MAPNPLPLSYSRWLLRFGRQGLMLMSCVLLAGLAEMALASPPRAVQLSNSSAQNSTLTTKQMIEEGNKLLLEGKNLLDQNNERVPVKSRDFPWPAIGRIMWPTSSTTAGTCTRTLISRDLVLTNAHCLVENIDPGTGQLKQPIFFFPSMKEGQILEEKPA